MWQLSELNRLLEEQENEAFGDSRTLCLANPAEKEEIDERIIEEIWPGAVAALRESAITTWIVPGQTLNETIKDGHGQYTTRTLTFLLEDPARPIGPECMKPWFCRIVIRCSALDYMVSSDAQTNHHPKRRHQRPKPQRPNERQRCRLDRRYSRALGC